MAMGSLSRDSALNTATRELGRVLIGWLVGENMDQKVAPGE